MNKKRTIRLYAIIFLVTVFSYYGCSEKNARQPKDHTPNIILMMADDMGWGDPAYNGNPVSKTPNLDKMAAEGIVFNRFYASSPVCSPTRGSCITGRHPYRYGIFFANVGHMRKEEITLAEALKTKGYVTGHFGKWHLGTLTKIEKDANRGGPEDTADYSPPWENGFDVCFSTESKVPTWNPMITPPKTAGGVRNRIPGEPYGTAYWTGPGHKATENLEGDDSRIIMDRVIPFIKKAIKSHKPFLAVVWFHTPHLPVLTGDKYKNMYKGQSVDIQNFYGAITAMDEQIGRLRNYLKEHGLYNNTVMFFTSDNGPEGKAREGRTQGSTKGLKGRKRSLYEGGIRVPGLMTWPALIKSRKTTDIPFSTLDYYPTVLDILGFTMPDQPEPIDGISMLPFIKGNMKERQVPIGFESKKQVAFMNNRYKIYSPDQGQHFELYDIINDPQETTDISTEHPDIVKELSAELSRWRESCKRSLEYSDYKQDF